MVIIVDGYNLLKQLYPRAKESLEIHKKTLVRKLGAYKRLKGEKIRELVVVFDGGSSTHADREVRNGVVLLHSGYKRSADDWIIDYSERHKNEEGLVVSMDRALCIACEKFGFFNMSVFEFMKAVEDVIGEEEYDEASSQMPSGTIKFDQHDIQTDYDFSENSDKIDNLMHDAALMGQPMKEHVVANRKSKSPGTRVSKQEKIILKKLKKII